MTEKLFTLENACPRIDYFYIEVTGNKTTSLKKLSEKVLI